MGVVAGWGGGGGREKVGVGVVKMCVLEVERGNWGQ